MHWAPSNAVGGLVTTLTYVSTNDQWACFIALSLLLCVTAPTLRCFSVSLNAFGLTWPGVVGNMSILFYCVDFQTAFVIFRTVLS